MVNRVSPGFRWCPAGQEVIPILVPLLQGLFALRIIDDLAEVELRGREPSCTSGRTDGARGKSGRGFDGFPDTRDVVDFGMMPPRFEWC